jgi:alpha-tubulin suppressor-like RCC1 family protein
MRLSLAVAGLGSVLALFGTTAAAVAAPARPAAAPAITAFKVSPSPVPAAGGKVTATAKVRAGRKCTFSIKPKVTGFPVTKTCSGGTASVTVKFPANSSVSTKHFTITLSVQGTSKTVTGKKALAQPPLTLTGVKAIVGQGQSYCALLTSGRVDCWGYNEFGQLGDGRDKTSSRPVAVLAVGGKGVLTGVASLTSDTLGYGFDYCAVLTSGGVDCWGYNLDGQLGDGTTKNSATPVAVEGVGGTGTLSGAKQVQPEVYGFCAALTSGGVVCWGLNSNGGLGDNSLSGPQECGETLNACSTTPVTVVSTSGSGSLGQVASLFGENSSMCALLTTTGVDCWGYGPNGQLGNGQESGSYYPAAVEAVGGSGTLTGVTSLTGYKDNGSNICARLSSGAVDCWGEDTWGELGNGTSGIFNDSSVPVAVKGAGGSGTLGSVAGVTGIPGLTNCVVLASGGVDCWGYDGDEALGDPSVSGISSDVPVKVVGPVKKGTLGGVGSLVAGDSENGGFACAVLTSGGVDCWGVTPSGYSNVPQAVAGFGSARASTRAKAVISDDLGSACAVLASGGASCWGDGVVGELGDGADASSAGAVAVLAPAP